MPTGPEVFDLKAWVTAVGVVVSAIGLAVSAGGLFYTGRQFKRTARTNDLQSLQKFFEQTTEREAALAQVSDPKAWLHALNEFLNFLEVYAAAYNRHLFGEMTSEMVRAKILDSWLELSAASDAHHHVLQAVDRSSTFEELGKFLDNNKTELDRRKGERQRRVAPAKQETT